MRSMKLLKIEINYSVNLKKTRLNGDKLNYNRARNSVQHLIKTKKKEFIKGQLEQKIGKPKELWKTLKSMDFLKKPVLTQIFVSKMVRIYPLTQKLMQILFVNFSLI